MELKDLEIRDVRNIELYDDNGVLKKEFQKAGLILLIKDEITNTNSAIAVVLEDRENIEEKKTYYYIHYLPKEYHSFLTDSKNKRIDLDLYEVFEMIKRLQEKKVENIDEKDFEKQLIEKDKEMDSLKDTIKEQDKIINEKEKENEKLKRQVEKLEEENSNSNSNKWKYLSGDGVEKEVMEISVVDCDEKNIKKLFRTRIDGIDYYTIATNFEEAKNKIDSYFRNSLFEHTRERIKNIEIVTDLEIVAFDDIEFVKNLNHEKLLENKFGIIV